MDTQKAFPKGIIAANTLAFAAAFAAWILFGPSVRTLAEELGLFPGARDNVTRSLLLLDGEQILDHVPITPIDRTRAAPPLRRPEASIAEVPGRTALAERDLPHPVGLLLP